jgi:hypothetical protein
MQALWDRRRPKYHDPTISLAELVWGSVLTEETGSESMSWNAREALLERGFMQIDENDSERFERGDLVAYLDYDAFPPYAVTGAIGSQDRR